MRGQIRIALPAALSLIAFAYACISVAQQQGTATAGAASTPEQRLVAVAQTVQWRQDRLKDGAALSECYLTDHIGLPIRQIREYLTFERIRVRLLTCGENVQVDARGAPAVITLRQIDLTNDRNIVVFWHHDRVDNHRRLEDHTWGKGWNRGLTGGTEIRLYGFTVS